MALSEIKNKKTSHVKISLYKLILVGLFSILISHIIINSDLPNFLEGFFLYIFGLDRLTMGFDGFTVDNKFKSKSPKISICLTDNIDGPSNKPGPTNPGTSDPGSSGGNTTPISSATTRPRPPLPAIGTIGNATLIELRA